jgi:UDP-2-acetamido-2,6-beta-L-arabino-hexul-4-ose reductase
VKILVSGANGFIGKNLLVRLREQPDREAIPILRDSSDETLRSAVITADAVIHLAGENRPASPEAFETGNAGFTRKLCELLMQNGNRCPVVFASSSQVDCDNPYGRSKLGAEAALEQLARSHGNPVAVFRLPGVFGKWGRPNYNSVVATFCHNIANGLPIQINDPSRLLRLVHVDDVVSAFVGLLGRRWTGLERIEVQPEYATTLGELAARIESFKNCRSSLVIERVGVGLGRALYSTYVSYLPVERFVYDVPAYGDSRGVFVEMLKTLDSGQFSFFSAHPGVTRGGHYHHTKTEKFLVVRGRARFGFRHLMTGQVHYVETCGDKPQVVETVPGWAHDVTNVGDDELVAMLWANEQFDRSLPDTIANKV